MLKWELINELHTESDLVEQLDEGTSWFTEYADIIDELQDTWGRLEKIREQDNGVELLNAFVQETMRL